MLREIREAALSYKRNNFNISNSGLHRASFWFGHAETILPVTTLLGLFNDSVGKEESEILYADGFNGWLSRVRTSPPLPTTFRAGHIIPFAGNLVLELYHCLNEISPQVGDPLAGFFVLPRVNNQTVAWPLASLVQPPTSKSPGAPFAPLSSVLNHLKACMPDAYNEEKHCNLD
ncbi:hypothetical protein CRM22_011007 [Opisthorchis felineus]|uniref:Multiple inositol polyphosphate phosphatase 1 n=1 Tax=Opisthorchis felineus TaxID=147828 RepID=A0A4S2KG77_OPIFE|nr:hypothetical protein CRM22_011007 [Opisthorchis felineus]